MPRVALTDSQRQEHRLDDLCRGVIEAIETTFVIKKRMNKQETAFVLGLHPNTWANWRTDRLSSGAKFRDVAKALDAAGYKLIIEPK